LRWNAGKFPSGIPALAAYVHGKGLKLGIYESANTATCVGLYGGVSGSVAVGSLGHEAQDAKTFADWGVDFLKYDLCAGQRSSLVLMGSALRAGTRPILHSINPGNGQNDLDPPKPGWDMAGVAQIWRIGFDIDASWSAVLRLIDENAGLYDYAGPGHFNDPDMLEVGRLANADENRAHFAMWAIMAAPLIAGNDVRSMSSATREILTNAEIIAVDQDPLAQQGRLVASPGSSLQVWSKTLVGNDVRAVALLNRGTTSASITVRWSDLGLPAGGATVRDLWAHADLGDFAASYTAAGVPAHGVAMLRVTSAP
jgi:alpha-galactosidase